MKSKIINQVERVFTNNSKNAAFSINGCRTFEEWLSTVWESRDKILSKHLHDKEHTIVVD